VSQAAAGPAQPQPGCTFSVTPPSEPFESNGGEGTVRVTASAPTCTWTAVSSVPWITLAAGGGTGSGSVRYAVVPNTGAARAGAIAVGTTAVTVTQAAAPAAPACEFTVSPPSESFPANGGDGTARVGASASTCAWTAVSSVPWITVSAGSGAGSANVRYAVAANSGAARTGTLTIARGTITVTQAAAPSEPACEFEVSPTSESAPASGGSETIRVGASSSTCAWSAVSHAPWIGVSTNGGSGSGSVRFTVAANSGAARTGTLTVARATVTIRQEAAPPCEFEVSPQSESFAVTGGEGRIRVRASGSSCTWAATSNASWIRLTSGGGNGDGDARYVVEPNPGAARSGTMTVARSTVVINQAAPAAPEPITLRGELSNLGGQCPNLTFTVDRRQVRTNGATVFQDRCERVRVNRDAWVLGLLQSDGSVVALHVNQEGRDD
jgi:hypothetical protein